MAMLRLFSSQFKLQRRTPCQLFSTASSPTPAVAPAAPVPSSSSEPMIVFAAKKDIDQSQWKMNFLTKLVSFAPFLFIINLFLLS
jgi:hypothetical protein